MPDLYQLMLSYWSEPSSRRVTACHARYRIASGHRWEDRTFGDAPPVSFVRWLEPLRLTVTAPSEKRLGWRLGTRNCGRAARLVGWACPLPWGCIPEKLNTQCVDAPRGARQRKPPECYVCRLSDFYERNRKIELETLYYLCSIVLCALTSAQVISAHWGKENRLHPVRDKDFGADQNVIGEPRFLPERAHPIALNGDFDERSDPFRRVDGCWLACRGPCARPNVASGQAADTKFGPVFQSARYDVCPQAADT
jgi:hypothetical protein